MATYPGASAFCGLRQARRQLGSRIVMAGAALSRSLSQPRALAGAVDCVREVSTLLDTVARIEDTLVFPCLERWLAKYAERIRITRKQRVKVERAVGVLMAMIGNFVSNRSASRASAMHQAATSVAVLFHDWVLLEEGGLYSGCDIDLGGLASRMLGGQIELLLAASPAASGSGE